MKLLSIVIPCFNEEEALPIYFDAVDKVLPEITKKDWEIEFVLINDGSRDKTLQVMEDLHNKRNDISYISLSRNFGQTAALSAGLSKARGELIIMMDVDLQDPVSLIPQMVEKYEEGYDVINAHRVDRSSDSSFKRNSASFFYEFINKLEGREVIPQNVNCFRGLSRRAVNEIVNLSEKDKLLLSEMSLIGYKNCYLDFKREERVAGVSKYSLKKLISYALDNISAGTTAPLYIPIKLGVFGCCFFFIAALAMTICYILSCNNVMNPGYIIYFQPCLILSWVFFGINIIIGFIGLLGVYMHNILINTRNRPAFIIDIYKCNKDKNK
jgi:glycosyltransferase involved in cell wall biosynthesis